jgi:hypothetical protein
MPSYIANKKTGDNLMKTALIRVLALATLASSMSAFAATDEPKHNDAATTSAKQQDGCPESTGHAKKQKKAKSQPDEQQDRQEKEFEHMLMGIYG